MMEAMVEIRCRGCRRLIGIGPADFRIYCSQQCAEDFTITSAEARDALIEAIFQETRISKTALAKEFGVSRQRVDQILTQRAYT